MGQVAVPCSYSAARIDSCDVLMAGLGRSWVYQAAVAAESVVENDSCWPAMSCLPSRLDLGASVDQHS